MKLRRGFLPLLLLCFATGKTMRGQAMPANPVLVASKPLSNDLALVRTAENWGSEAAVLPEAPASSLSQSPASTQAQGAAAWQPLTTEQRFSIFWDDTYNSPGAFVALSVGAMFSQMTGTPGAWSDGNGYTRRFASGYGQLAIRNVVHEGLDGVTGLDPRYTPCNCKGAFKRSTHALKMSVTTYTRDGRMTLDAPQIAGAYGSGMISTYWYPHSHYSPLVQGVQFGHEEMAEVVIGNLFQEFGRDMKRALHLGSSSTGSSSEVK
jgi:hypothetical protein